jgi:lipase
MPYKTHDADVAGGALRVLSWGAGPRHALAVHGLTGNAACWQAVARALPEEWTLYAVDLRGRGHSAALPGPYGFDKHVADLRDVVRVLGLDGPVLAGHSLGAYIALLAADSDPEIFGRLVLVDGGLPLLVADLDQIRAGLGPSLARLTQTYKSAEAYVDLWRAHPALAHAWTADIEHTVRYELTGEPGQLRSRVTADAVRSDFDGLFESTERIQAALDRLASSTPLLRAPAGLLGQPPGLIPDDLAAYWQAQSPALAMLTIPDTNHYTIVFSEAAAKAIAAHIGQVGAS